MRQVLQKGGGEAGGDRLGFCVVCGVSYCSSRTGGLGAEPPIYSARGRTFEFNRSMLRRQPVPSRATGSFSVQLKTPCWANPQKCYGKLRDGIFEGLGVQPQQRAQSTLW